MRASDDGAGIGPTISSGEVFSKDRDFSAWLGLVPRRISTGDRTILGKDIQARQSLAARFVRGGDHADDRGGHVNTEAFQLSDAQLFFAQSAADIACLSMWSVGRDNGTCA